jgi:CPA2 family monovalent cation:H+ antiporter-2
MEEQISGAVEAVGGVVEQAVEQVVEQAVGQGGHHGDACSGLRLRWLSRRFWAWASCGSGSLRWWGSSLPALLLGPTGMGVISTSENVALLAEWAWWCCSSSSAWNCRSRPSCAASSQAVLVAGGQLVASMALADCWPSCLTPVLSETIILGFIIALSSTVVAMKMLDEMGELRSAPGRSRSVC